MWGQRGRRRWIVAATTLVLLALGTPAQAHNSQSHTVYGYGPASVVTLHGSTFVEQQGKVALTLHEAKGTLTVSASDPLVAPVPHKLECAEHFFDDAPHHKFRFSAISPDKKSEWRGFLFIVEEPMAGYAAGTSFLAVWKPSPRDAAWEARYGPCSFSLEGAAYADLFGHGVSKKFKILEVPCAICRVP